MPEPDRDRKDRNGQHSNHSFPSTPSSSSGGGGGGGGGLGLGIGIGNSAGARFLSRRVWGRASATTKTSTGNEELAELSASTVSSSMNSNSYRKESTDESTKPPPPPFHLDEAIHLMDPSASSFNSISGPELVEHVKATSVYIANVGSNTAGDISALGESETSTPTVEKGATHSIISTDDMSTLYIRAVSFADRNTDISLRIAGIRLLTSLISACPPPKSIAEPSSVSLPDNITFRSLYTLIKASSHTSGEKKVDLIGAQVVALKALTKDGIDVEGLSGLVGWLMRMLDEVRGEWTKWCETKAHGENDVPQRPVNLKPFETITPYNPLEAASVIIDLIHSITGYHIDLFDPDVDIPRLLKPIVTFVSKGIVASSPSAEISGLNISQSQVQLPNPMRRESIQSAFNSPLPSSNSQPVFDSSLRRSTSINKRTNSSAVSSAFNTPSSSRIARHSAVASPHSLISASARHSPSPLHPTVPIPRWMYILPSVCAFFEILIDNTLLLQDHFVEIMRFACICVACDDELGLPTDAGQVPVHRLLAVMFRSNSGRRAEQALRVIMEQQASPSFRKTYDGLVDVDCKVIQGAVYIARSLLLHLDDPAPGPSSLPLTALSSLSPSLIAAVSTSRITRFEDRSEHSRWEPVDYAVLTLLQDSLHRLELNTAKESAKWDIWTEGQAACDILKALLPVALPPRPSGLSLTFAEETSTFTAVFDAVVHQLPSAIERLHPFASTVSPFYHPKYIELLFHFGDHLAEDDAAVILDYYQREGLCLPMTAGWIENVWKLIDTFFQSSLVLPNARQQLSTIIFKDIYPSTEEMAEPRSEFVDKILVPFLDKVLLKQTDDWFRQEALQVMIRAAVAETMERDEERRRVRAMKADSEVEEEDASAIPSQEVKEAAAGGSFHAIRNFIITLASTAWCKEEGVQEKKRPAQPANRDSVISTSSNSSALKGLMNVLSPPSRTKELPSVAPSIASTDDVLPKRPTTSHATHANCQSLSAVTALITIFNRLTFSPPHSFSSTAKAARTPASSRCIAIYRDLLGLLLPFNEHPAGDQTPTSRIAAVPARCPRARVAILQWLLRLRADPRHRIYLRTELDIVAKPYAETLFRTTDAVEAQRSKLATDAEEARAKSKARQSQQQQLSATTGRESLRDRTSTATRSRSRSRPSPLVPEDTFNPLWSVPENLAFKMPADSLPSEGLLTYDPNHPSLRNEHAPPVEGVWLPVSEYVRALNGILRHERNWELVSYVLCFLPLQLGNKLFFRGGRATKEVKALLKALVDLIPQDDRIERRCNFHSYIKRPNVNAAVYQSLSILISYRDVLDPPECDALIVAFEMCLESNTVVAKPCIQALTLSVFELEQHLGKRLLGIIGKLRDINFTSGIAVHLIEFFLALGQNGDLFRNFTDAHYKDVFTLVIDYIGEHNARSDTAPDLEAPAARETYTLSQHVIGLAYHAIYVWFIALKLSVRPDLVKHIIVKLLQSRSKRVAVDEMAEICLDWLARYTYGNADPKPASSFLADMVMQDPREEAKPKTQSWLLGGCIITIVSHARTGWASITSTRPTGATTIIAKLENVPLLNLGEANADLTSLPAVLMANRNVIMNEASAQAAGIVNETTHVQPQDETDQKSQQGYIWSGATPSQRRKDVSIDPAYLAVELLSSYPNANLETPRGRLIPNEEKFLRTLRTIEVTPVIDNSKLGVLYVARGQTDETEILGNTDGSSLYLDFLAGLGRLVRLKGQMDIHVGGLNREDDSDGEYAYAWWDDLQQTIFHTATMMPNAPNDPTYARKKRLIGNDYVKIVYNDSGRDFAFDTIRTAFNFINIVISPHTTPESHGPRPVVEVSVSDPWAVWGRDDYFKVIVQRAPGIPDFSPVGEQKIVSRETLPIFVRHVAHLANDMAARYTHIRDARSPAEAEYITSWRSRLRAMNRLRAMLPPVDKVDPSDDSKREEMLRDFTRVFSQRPLEPSQ